MKSSIVRNIVRLDVFPASLELDFNRSQIAKTNDIIKSTTHVILIVA